MIIDRADTAESGQGQPTTHKPATHKLAGGTTVGEAINDQAVHQ
ncbi:MAG TPA: hypothetical protein VHX38_27285 [Pseudonocardiaceae bacterium]|jgi:hypothetical protein|nr:hypothetical protein [Pseudonocardiaceae bacterium]